MGVGEMGGTRSTRVTDAKWVKHLGIPESGLTELRVSAGLV